MAIPVEMPRLSDTMEEGTLNKWHVKVGDPVSAGDVVADVETDKANMELTVYDDGTVAYLVDEGESLPVGQTILVLAEKGESVEDAAKQVDTSAPAQQGGEEETEQAKGGEVSGGNSATATKTAPSPTSQSTSGPEPVSAPGDGRMVKASPLARNMAEENGIDLSQIEGSGPNGRVIKRDIEAVLVERAEGSATREAPKKPEPAKQAPAPEKPAEAPAPAPVSTAPPLEAKRIKLSNMRKTIAKRLVESKTTIPHFQVTVAVNTEPLEQLRAEVNADLADDGIKLSVNDFITRACALALLQHPRVNAAWADGEIIQHGSINIGFAVALPEEQGGGLVVPVLHHAHAKTLRQLNAETKALAKKARSTGLSVEDMQDGTFCVSNLGMYGVEHFTAIINPPQAAILAVGAALDKPVVRDGQLVAGREMQMTLSGDHRVIDGATAAEFLQTVQKLLEKPRALMA